MLGGVELRALSLWCCRRDMTWSPAHSADGPPVMMLRARDDNRPWQRMMLVLDTSELRLENELGETLASASDLPALLDAVEGGVAETPTQARRLGGLPASTLGFIL
jgi:hypothetical protein